MADVDEFGLPVDEDEETETPKQDSEGIKQLRKAFKEKSKALDDALAKLAVLERKEKATSVGSLFESAGASPKLAKFFLADAGDAEPDEAAVKAWLEENGELFGYEPPSEEPDETQKNIERVQQAASNGKPSAAASQAELVKSLDPKDPDFYSKFAGLMSTGS